MATQRFKVTFFNVLANRRGHLLEDLSADEAEAVRARFSDKSDPHTFLPDVRVEEEQTEAA